MITVWFMRGSIRIESREYSKDVNAWKGIKKRAKVLRKQYEEPIEAFEIVGRVAEAYPADHISECERCGHKWLLADIGVNCPKCGHDNFPF